VLLDEFGIMARETLESPQRALELGLLDRVTPGVYFFF
jgi:hypothetical protein